MQQLVKLNNTQQEQLVQILAYYKYFYICNKCGIVYGTDSLEVKERLCPTCENEQIKERKKNK